MTTVCFIEYTAGTKAGQRRHVKLMGNARTVGVHLRALCPVLGSLGRITRHSEKGGLWCSRRDWLTARTADHAIHFDGLLAFHRLISPPEISVARDTSLGLQIPIQLRSGQW